MQTFWKDCSREEGLLQAGGRGQIEIRIFSGRAKQHHMSGRGASLVSCVCSVIKRYSESSYSVRCCKISHGCALCQKFRVAQDFKLDAVVFTIPP